ncbi:glycosyltransferase [Vreelandella sp. EE22]
MSTSFDTPRVSLLIRSMDRDHLHSVLASADAQRYPFVDILVVNAKGEPHRALPTLDTPCRLIESDTPLKRAEAANAALKAVETPLALFLDDDDLIDPHHIERLVEALDAQPQAPAAYAGVRLEKTTGEALSTTDAPWVPGELLVHNTLPIHAVLFRMAAVEKGACRFDTQFSELEDWDFWLQLARQGAFVHVPGASATYRLALGESGLSQQRDVQAYQSARSAVWQKWLPQVDEALLQNGLAALIDRLEQLEWDTQQLHASEAALHQRDHERLGQLLELREHYEKLQGLHSELHQAHGGAWEKLSGLGKEHEQALARLSSLQKDHDGLQKTHGELQQTLATLKQTLQQRIDEQTHTQERLAETRHAHATLEQAHADAQHRLHLLGEELHAMRHSRSMRLTRPLRWLTDQLRHLRGDTPDTPGPAQDDLPIAQGTQTEPKGPVDIIVPVYKGLDETRDCLESVWASTPKHAYRLVVINDSSPEPELTEWLREAARTRPMLLLENEENLGFVGTVNRGMAHSNSADVLLLNSDAEVANDWLDRMIAAAYRPGTRPVSSVTPFSNNATICSYPRFCEDNDLPLDYDLPTLDRLFAKANAGQSVDIPTAIGFCMYIRRDCLDDVGLFDVENFGKGYGEENDFCMRALKAGWRHVHALDVFSWHKGGVSFGDSQPERVKKALAVLDELHPDYHRRVHSFIADDPARFARTAVEIEQLHQSQLPTVLMLNHQRGGGTEQHCRELVSRVSDVNWLILRPDTEGHVVLSRDLQAGSLTLRYHLLHDWKALTQMLSYLGVQRLHWHHWLGFDQRIHQLAEALGVEQDVTLHDYYSVCPEISLTDDKGRYCGEDNCAKCTGCLPAQAVSEATTLKGWRDYHHQWLSRAQRIITPSADAAERINRYYPDLSIIAAAHPDTLATYPAPVRPSLEKGEPLRVAVLGALSMIKGADVLEDTASEANRQGAALEFKLFGFAYRSLKTLPNLSNTGPYQGDELIGLLEEWQPHVVWFPAQWPETYSYTLSICLSMGIPVVASNLGAFEERLANRPMSWILPWNTPPAEWVARFETLREEGALQDALPRLDKPTPLLSYYPGDYAAPLKPKAAKAGGTTPVWRPHMSAMGATGYQRQRLLKALYWLRERPSLRFLSQRIPPSLQRRVKSAVLGEAKK